MDHAAQDAVFVKRFRELGYSWANRRVKVGRHVFDANHQPRSKHGLYFVVCVEYNGLQRAKRLFKAVLAGKSIVLQGSGCRSGSCGYGTRDPRETSDASASPLPLPLSNHDPVNGYGTSSA